MTLNTQKIVEEAVRAALKSSRKAQAGTQRQLVIKTQGTGKSASVVPVPVDSVLESATKKLGDARKARASTTQKSRIREQDLPLAQRAIIDAARGCPQPGSLTREPTGAELEAVGGKKVGGVAAVVASMKVSRLIREGKL
jgi:hypothetical protein